MSKDKVQAERWLFYQLAEPLRMYFVRNGIEDLQAGIMAANIASEQFNYLESRVEIKRKSQDQVNDMQADSPDVKSGVNSKATSNSGGSNNE